MCEGSITAGFMIVSAMFYTRPEQTRRVGYWCKPSSLRAVVFSHCVAVLMNGTAQIISGFIAFGSLHIKTSGFEPWQWLMIICGVLTLITAVCYWFLFPDSPTNAWFLTPEERITAVNRIKGNQAGVENKHFKKEQYVNLFIRLRLILIRLRMIECLKDPKTWIFALFSCLDNIPNSLTNQQSLIINSFGFTQLQTTLLGCISG